MYINEGVSEILVFLIGRFLFDVYKLKKKLVEVFGIINIIIYSI